jgi:hypothetical protein
MLKANYSNSSTNGITSAEVHAKVSTETLSAEGISELNTKGVRMNNNGSAVDNNIIDPASIVNHTISSTDGISCAEVQAKVSAETLSANNIAEPNTKGV